MRDFGGRDYRNNQELGRIAAIREAVRVALVIAKAEHSVLEASQGPHEDWPTFYAEIVERQLRKTLPALGYRHDRKTEAPV